MSGKYKTTQNDTNKLPPRSSTEITDSKRAFPLNYGGLGYTLFERLSHESDKIIQVDTVNNITETKAALKSRATQLAIEMLQKNVGFNDIILISSKTHSHQTVVILATLFLGACVAPINNQISFAEFSNLVKKLNPKMCFCDSRTVSQLERVLSTLNLTSIVVNFGNEMVGTIQFHKLFPLNNVKQFRPVFIQHPHKEVAFILPTLGTSDNAKLVCVSHHAIYTQCIKFMDLFDNPSKIISFFPLSWIIETIIVCLSLNYGVTRIMPSKFNERIACKMIHDYAIDLALLGTRLTMKLTGNIAIKDYNLSCLRSVVIGVGNTTKSDLFQMHNVLPRAKFFNIYTLTETGCISAAIFSAYSDATKEITVGKLLCNSKIKIVDIDTKQISGRNQYGELYYNGDGLMLGYFKDPEATIAAFDKSYFKTGDLAKCDDDGFIYLLGRIVDMITIDNIRISLVSLERALLSHPLIREAAIITSENKLYVYIEKQDTNDEITSESVLNLISARIPNYHSRIKIVFLDELPRTAASNVSKRELKEQFLNIKLEYTKSLASIVPTIQSSIKREK